MSAAKRPVNWPALICIVMLGALNVFTLVNSERKSRLIETQNALIKQQGEYIDRVNALWFDGSSEALSADDIAAPGAGLVAAPDDCPPNHVCATINLDEARAFPSLPSWSCDGDPKACDAALRSAIGIATNTPDSTTLREQQ